VFGSFPATSVAAGGGVASTADEVHLGVTTIDAPGSLTVAERDVRVAASGRRAHPAERSDGVFVELQIDGAEVFLELLDATRPYDGAITADWSASQRRATCAGVAPISRAMRTTALIVDQLRSELAYSSETHW
jgi:hypothetical protein